MTLARNKYHTNALLRGMGFDLPGAVLISGANIPDLSVLNFPVIVKLNNESDSIGIDEHSIASTEEIAAKQVESLFNRFNRKPVIVEEYIPGDEIKVAVFGSEDTTFAAGAVVTCRQGVSLAGSLQMRSDVLGDTLDYLTLEEPLKSKVCQLAKEIHINMGLRDYSRCDFRLDSSNRPICMEVSTHPDLTPSNSSFVQGALQHFFDFDEIIGSLITNALQTKNI